MNNSSWQCPKCSSPTYEQGEMRATGGFFSKIFDVQTNKFTTITCKNCGFTELYKRSSSIAGNVFDFFVGS